MENILSQNQLDQGISVLPDKFRKLSLNEENGGKNDNKKNKKVGARIADLLGGSE
jgi:hypothetical protein